MPLPNQSTVKSAVASLTEILKTWPGIDPDALRLLAQLEAGWTDLDRKLNKTSPSASLTLPSITASVTL
jgi:hypothetical protein